MSRLIELQKQIRKQSIEDLSFNCGTDDIGILQAVYRIEAYRRAGETSTLSKLLTEYDLSVDLSGRGASISKDEQIQELIFLLACRAYSYLSPMTIAVSLIKGIGVNFTKDQTRTLFDNLDSELKKAIRFYLLRVAKVRATDFYFKKTMEKYITYDDLLKESLGL